MKVASKETEEYLRKFDWQPDRKVKLPAYIDTTKTPPIVISILENLYGLKFIDPHGYKRVFKVDDIYIQDINEITQEWREDTDLEIQFYPLGEMSEHGGILVLDQYGRFYLAGDELLYYGDTFEQFVNCALFRKRSCISLRENGTTYYCYNDKNTGYLFDIEKGWLGDQHFLDLDYIKANE